MRSRHFRKAFFRTGLLAALVVVLLLLFQPSLRAQSDQQLSFRISRLESENRALRSRLGQLESQIDRLSRASGIALPAPAPVDPSLAPGDSAIASDPMFDRLATLVIETRQDVFALQEQVSDLEARVTGGQS